MGSVKKHIVSMTHEDAVKAMETGEIVIDDVTLDCKTDVLSKLSFCREGDMWESGQSDAGDAVVAVDCTQDKAILDAGKAREFISYVQQLRKGAGLIITDAIEVFYHEENGVSSTESAIAGNVDLIVGKLKVTPLPKRFMAPWSVIFDSGEFEVGSSKVEIIISRPAVVAKDDISEQLSNLLSTMDIGAVEANENISFVIDGEKVSVTEGVDFWASAAGMVKATSALDWLS